MKIGIPSWKVGPNSFGATIPYIMWVSQFGTPYFINPDHDPNDYDNLDAIVMPGGADVDPSRYNDIPSYMAGNINPHLEGFDRNMLPYFVERDIPIFGICRGFQSLNILFGGSIDQHHVHEQSKDRDDEAHQVKFVDNFETTFDFKNKTFKVNSMHHQCIFDEDLSDQLEPILKHNDGTVESYIHTSKPIAGVQYHPEELLDDFAIMLFDYILESKEKFV